MLLYTRFRVEVLQEMLERKTSGTVDTELLFLAGCIVSCVGLVEEAQVTKRHVLYFDRMMVMAKDGYNWG